VSKSESIKVHLLGTPADLHKVSAEHYDSARREMALIVVEDDSRPPAEIPAVMEEIQDRYGSFAAVTEHLEESLATGAGTVDLNFNVTPAMGVDCERLGEVLDQIDVQCRDGRYLLTLPNPRAELYRRWFLGEVTGQLGGAAPIPWADSPEAGELAELEADEAADAEAVANSPETVLSVAHRSSTSVTLRLTGEVDLDQAPALRRLFADLLADGVKEITVDGGGVEFIDSVGVSVLMAMLSRCTEAGGSLQIQAPSLALLATLELAGVADMLIAA
jgi:anti-sigma B factor antagonist